MDGVFEGGSEGGRAIREYVREWGTGGEEGGKDGREGDPGQVGSQRRREEPAAVN